MYLAIAFSNVYHLSEICEAIEDPESCDFDAGWYLCKDNHTCIAPTHVCDGNPQCHDKSDEGDFCQKRECADAKCAQGCLQTPEGPQCYCLEGYR